MLIPQTNALGLIIQDIGRALYGEFWLNKMARRLGMERTSLTRLCVKGPRDSSQRQAIITELQAIVAQEYSAAGRRFNEEQARVAREHNERCTVLEAARPRLNAARGTA